MFLCKKKWEYSWNILKKTFIEGFINNTICTKKMIFIYETIMKFKIKWCFGHSITLTPISCDGSNRLWRQRLLPSPCSLLRHKQTHDGVVRPLAGGKCQVCCRVTERYRFHWYLCSHCVFCVGFFFFVYGYVRTAWPYRTKTLFILIALWVLFSWVINF